MDLQGQSQYFYFHDSDSLLEWGKHCMLLVHRELEEQYFVELKDGMRDNDALHLRGQETDSLLPNLVGQPLLLLKRQ